MDATASQPVAERPPSLPRRIQRVPELDAWIGALPAPSRARVLGARQRMVRREYQGALDDLAEFRDGRPLPWQIHFEIGRLLEELGRAEEAVGVLRDLLRVLDDEGDLVPENLQVALGSALVGARRFEEAIPILEQAWRRPGSLDHGHIYHQLSVAYAMQGRRALAVEAIELALAANPQDALGREVIAREAGSGGAASAPRSGRLPPHPDPAGIRRIALLPPLFAAPEEDLPQLASAYLDYAATLEAGGWINAAARYRSLVVTVALASATESCERNRHSDCLRELAALAARPHFARFPSLVHERALRYEVVAQASEQRFLHAATALESLAQYPGMSARDIADLADLIRDFAFSAISFDPMSGAPRASDPDDFLSEEWSQALMEAGSPSAPPPTRDAGVDAGSPRPDHPYAEVSADEDHAVMMTVIITLANRPTLEPALLSLIQRRIEQHNFELPVKIALHKWVGGFLDRPVPGGSDTLRTLLDREISGAMEGSVPSVTLDAYHATRVLGDLVGNPPFRREEIETPAEG